VGEVAGAQCLLLPSSAEVKNV